MGDIKPGRTVTGLALKLMGHSAHWICLTFKTFTLFKKIQETTRSIQMIRVAVEMAVEVLMIPQVVALVQTWVLEMREVSTRLWSSFGAYSKAD